ncbi:NADP-dependent oxidoreductase [Nocardia noduli]|uniref:NADP-dependent oxidoreductase n=1 Tax=Nocardia noduli TaxID=2815722 RepID=UPI001C223E38|nr:NADP-dependent oxidoreductase [Nocardia noduli]
MAVTNTAITLARRPRGRVRESDFRIVESPVPDVGAGDVLIRNHYLSLDPYMRGRMDDSPSYAQPVMIGETMIGATVGEVIDSNNDRFIPGDMVTGFLGWQLYAVATRGRGLTKIDSRDLPMTAYLGAAGMPGVAAWIGMTRIADPLPGKTVVISAASGAVGSAAGQIAKIKGARTIGIAGGAEKCAYVVDELGFDACVDHRSEAFASDLAASASHGVDIYFDNVGGKVLETVVQLLNPFACIPLRGLVSQYNEVRQHGLDNLQAILSNRVRMQGFIVSDQLDLWPSALADLSSWLVAGKVKYKETIAEGIESAPSAFIGVLNGENFGKQLVRLGP